jgi:hypothetical protein
VGLGADQGGFVLKAELSEPLRASGYEIEDYGAYELDSADDYPDFIIPLARPVADARVERAVALCGSGVGGNRTQGGKIHGRGSRVFNSLRSPISIGLGTSMAYGFCGRRQRAVLRSAQPGGPVAGQGWHTGKTVF